MADSIIVKYEADMSGLKASLQELKLQQLGLLKTVEDYGIKSKEAAEKTSTAVKGASKEVGGLENQFNKLGAQIIAAFAVNAIIQFGKTSVEAFAKAEKAQLQLLNALNGNSAAQQRLIGQAKELQSALGVDDDTIVSQQAFLALQGRTEEQISKTIQAAIQLSAVTGEDLPSAVAKLDATFEGNIGRLGKLDSRFNQLSSTQLANGAAVDLINEKYKGFAESGAASVAGQLEIQKRRVEELSESIGGILAPAWVGVKKAALEYIEQQLQAFGIGASDADKQVEHSKKAIIALTEKQFAEKSAAEIEKELVKESIVLNELRAKKQTVDVKLEIQLEQTRIDALTELWNKRLSVIKDGGDKQIETLENLKKQKEDLEKKQQFVTAGPAADALIKQITEVQKKIDEITGKAAEDRRKKAEEDAKKKQDDLKAALEKEIQINEDANNKAAEINVSAIADEKERLTAKAVAEIEQIKATGFAKVILETAIRRKLASDLQAIDDKNAQGRIDTQNEINDAQMAAGDALLEDFEKNEKAKADADKQTREAILQGAQQLAGELAGLFNAQDSAEMEAINIRKEASLSAIDEELAALDEQHSKRKIGDRDYEKSKTALLNKRKADEKKFADETKKIQREQAERDKALVIFNIILKTAEAVITNFVKAPFLATLAAILGAAELAIAVATPIPQFAKGTKGKKESGMGLVGEEGAEFVYMPQGTQVLTASKTKQHREALNAMMDGNFEQYVYKAMIAPALMQASRKLEKDRSKSFAENIAHSFSYTNGMDEYGMIRALGKNNKNNAEAIAEALARYLKSDSNSRYIS